MKDKVWMSPMEVAKALNYSIQRVYQLANQGVIPCEYYCPKKNLKRRFRREEINRIIKARRFNTD